jgi:hypothetical protein
MRLIVLATLAGLLAPYALAVSPSADSESAFIQHGKREVPAPHVATPAAAPLTVVGDSPNAEIHDTPADQQRARYDAGQYARAVADSHRLAQLANELEADLERSGNNTLPSAAFKKADEIAKLAKGVKERLRPR